jgi:hypothetical protein
MPPDQASTVPTVPNFYQPPDVFNPDLHPPPGEVDVLNIVEAGVDFKSTLSPDYTHFYKKPTFANGPPKVPIGKGMHLHSQPGDDLCDGSVDSFCARGTGNNCLLYGHNDYRSGVAFDGFSGWVIMNLPELKNGFVFVKFETWHKANSMEETAGWTSVNNQTQRRRLPSSFSSRSSNNNTVAMHHHIMPATETKANVTKSNQRTRRRLGDIPLPDSFCDDFKFEYAIDGKITIVDKNDFIENRHHKVQRVVETVTLLKDPNYTGGQEKEVEVAVRITGCQRIKKFSLTHIYWS